MTTWTKNLSRFTTLMVAIMVLLGIAVSGCSSENRNSNSSSTDKAALTYKFAVPASVQKATNTAYEVILTAKDAAGNALKVNQPTTIISEHDDITPEGLAGGKIYQGDAVVNNAKAGDVLTFTFTYLDEEGAEAGEADVVTATIAEDATVLADATTEDSKYAAIKVATPDIVVGELTDETFAALPAEFDVVKGDNEFVVVGQIASEEGNTYEAAEGATLELDEETDKFAVKEGTTTITVNDNASSGDICALSAICGKLQQGIIVTVAVEYDAIKVADKNTDVTALTDDTFNALPDELNVYVGDNEFIVVGKIASEEGNTYEAAQGATLQLTEKNANFEVKNDTTITVKETAIVDETCGVLATCGDTTPQAIKVTVKDDVATWLCMANSSGTYTHLQYNDKINNGVTFYTNDLVICRADEEWNFYPIDGITISSFTVNGDEIGEEGFKYESPTYDNAQVVATYNKVTGYSATHVKATLPGGGK